MTLQERIMKCIRMVKGSDFEETTQLITGGYLDSMDIISLIAKFEDEFEIMIPMEEADPDYFNNLTSIEALIKRNGVDE